jgi:predicted DNA-binding transcriptional regulator AlpA
MDRANRSTTTADRSPDDLLIAADLARYLNVTEKTIKRYVDDGVIPPPIQFGGQTRWVWGDVQDWVRALSVLARMGKKKNSLDTEGHGRTNDTHSGTNQDTDEKADLRGKKTG